MISPAAQSQSHARSAVTVQTHERATLALHLERWTRFMQRHARTPLSRDPGWLPVLDRSLGHVPYCLEAVASGMTVGLLPLTFVESALFGRFLVSLSYLNVCGVSCDDPEVASALVNRAVQLADDLDVRYLELRHERAIPHPRLTHTRTDKVHMRLELPANAETLWSALSAKVRNQVRKGQKNGLEVLWGGWDLLGEFYHVFSCNMRDLGTPVYSRNLFRSIIESFPDRAEICIVRDRQRSLAGALLVHGQGTSEVPSASSLRRYNHSNANMLMYWHLLERSVLRGQQVFDFGRSTRESSTYRFKEQWGATPHPAEWQYYIRMGSPDELRTDNPRHRWRVGLWRRLPVAVTKWIGPLIVRGIP